MESNEYLFDPGEVAKSALSLGAYKRPSEYAVQFKYPSIGYIEGSRFEPRRWKSNYPVPAFENATDRDAFWGAKIVASFTDDQITAAVESGRYTDPEARQFLIETLRQRRNRIADYWFRRVAPMDRFVLGPAGLTFDDLALRSGRDNAPNVRYRMSIRSDFRVDVATEFAPGKPIPIPFGELPVEVRITRQSPNWPELGVSVLVAKVDGVPAVIGIRR
jgi:hypothetical protein